VIFFFIIDLVRALWGAGAASLCTLRRIDVKVVYCINVTSCSVRPVCSVDRGGRCSR